MKKLYFRLCLVALFLVACGPKTSTSTAQSVNLKTYYSRANGKKGAELKTALFQVIGNPSVKSYSSLWTYYYDTDRLANNQVVDRYCNEKRYFTGRNGNAISGMNKEHGIPQSWWGGGTTGIGSDLHHVMPSDTEANSRKSNYGMGVVVSQTWTNGSIKVGRGEAGNNGTVLLWEPADEWKGDFARIYFYIVTAYEDKSLVQKEGVNSMQSKTYPKLQPWASQLYLKWARQDPVSDMERQRNDAVYTIQGNRNPFIDYPSLAEFIWGDSINYAFDVSLSHGLSQEIPDNPDNPDNPEDPNNPDNPDNPDNPVTPDAESGSFILSDLTWTSANDATYGAGFATTANGLMMSYYKADGTVTPVNISQYSELRLYDKAVFRIEGAEVVGVTFHVGDKKGSLVIGDETLAFGSDGTLSWKGSMQPFEATAIGQSRIKSIDVAIRKGEEEVEVSVQPLKFLPESVEVYSTDGRFLGCKMPVRRGTYVVRNGTQVHKYSVK